MKKAVAFLLTVIYFIASSALAHSFCIQWQGYNNETQSSLICCNGNDSWNKDCYDHCLWDYDITVMSSIAWVHDDNFLCNSFLSIGEKLLFDKSIVNKHTTYEDVPVFSLRLDEYVASIKKIE